jgi:uncharacterized membrane protein
MNPPAGDSAAQTESRVSADDLTRDNVQSMRRVEEQALANRSSADRIAAFVAGFCGSMPFVWLHVLWFSCWLLLSSWPGIRHFDPYPFTFLTLVVSLEAIFLSAFILISQNYELRISDRRSARARCKRHHAAKKPEPEVLNPGQRQLFGKKCPDHGWPRQHTLQIWTEMVTAARRP